MKEWVIDSAMRTYNMNEAQDPYEHEEDVMGGIFELEMLKPSLMGGGFKILPHILQPP